MGPFYAARTELKKAIIRLDSGGDFGLGHVMRCKALADALTELQIKCTFGVHRLHSSEVVEPHELIFIENEAEFLMLAASFDIIIIDHYDYSSKLFNRLAQLQQSSLVILDDECNRGQLYADVLINPVKSANNLPYTELAPDAELLLGPEYLLLRKVFQKIQLVPFEKRDTIVVTFGGSDVSGLTLPVLKILKITNLERFNIHVVTGAACKNTLEIGDYCEQNGFIHQHDVENMAQIFARARLAISAAGSTAFELACCGVPSVFAVVADNQYLSIMEQSQNGWCKVVDCREKNRAEQLVFEAKKLLDKSLELKSMSQVAKSLINGRGADRVAMHIHSNIQSK